LLYFLADSRNKCDKQTQEKIFGSASRKRREKLVNEQTFHRKRKDRIVVQVLQNMVLKEEKERQLNRTLLPGPRIGNFLPVFRHLLSSKPVSLPSRVFTRLLDVRQSYSQRASAAGS
jgi:hypothetical protein